MILDVVPILENEASKILPKLPEVVRFFLIRLDRPRAMAAVSGGYSLRASFALG